MKANRLEAPELSVCQQIGEDFRWCVVWAPTWMPTEVFEEQRPLFAKELRRAALLLAIGALAIIALRLIFPPVPFVVTRGPGSPTTGEIFFVLMFITLVTGGLALFLPFVLAWVLIIVLRWFVVLIIFLPVELFRLPALCRQRRRG